MNDPVIESSMHYLKTVGDQIMNVLREEKIDPEILAHTKDKADILLGFQPWSTPLASALGQSLVDVLMIGLSQEDPISIFQFFIELMQLSKHWIHREIKAMGKGDEKELLDLISNFDDRIKHMERICTTIYQSHKLSEMEV